MKETEENSTDRIDSGSRTGTDKTINGDAQKPVDTFTDLDASFEETEKTNLLHDNKEHNQSRTGSDFSSLLEASLAINSSFVFDDVLQIAIGKAVEFMRAERGLIMLFDDTGELIVRSICNLRDEFSTGEYPYIPESITSKVATTGKSIYIPDAMTDEKYSCQPSVPEMHLRSIMCVPIKDKGQIIGVIYIDNSTSTRRLPQSDLYIFELYAQMIANALRNAGSYDSLLTLQKYNESVIKKTPVGTVVIDQKLNVVTINSVALEVLDLNRRTITSADNDIDSTNFLRMLPKDEVPCWRRMIITTLATGEDLSEPRHFHNTGYLEKVLSVKISPISALPSGDNGLIITVEDVTDMVSKENIIILSEKLAAKGEMITSVVHELNNYLAVVSTNAELLNMNIDRENYDKAKFNSHSIVENIFKIKRFVDNMKDLTKPELEFMSYDIRSLINDLLFSLQVHHRFKRSHFTIDLDSDIPRIEMDVSKIQQVLMNLLNNAADAIEEKAFSEEIENESFKSEIEITATYDKNKEQVSVEITDNGIGISKEMLGKIYNHHFTTRKGGRGLGLSNCKRIIESHHGEISTESTPGKGSSFRITLPCFQPGKTKL